MRSTIARAASTRGKKVDHQGQQDHAEDHTDHDTGNGTTGQAVAIVAIIVVSNTVGLSVQQVRGAVGGGRLGQQNVKGARVDAVGQLVEELTGGELGGRSHRVDHTNGTTALQTAEVALLESAVVGGARLEVSDVRGGDAGHGTGDGGLDGQLVSSLIGVPLRDGDTTDSLIRREGLLRGGGGGGEGSVLLGRQGTGHATRRTGGHHGRLRSGFRSGVSTKKKKEHDKSNMLKRCAD